MKSIGESMGYLWIVAISFPFLCLLFYSFLEWLDSKIHRNNRK